MIPLIHIKNIKIYYLLSFLFNAWFFAGNWIFFWLTIVSYRELGIIDSLAFAFGMLMEIPTGAIADLIGKKKTILASFSLTSLGFLVMAFSSGFTLLLIGFLIAQLGWALYSGSAEALAYDSLLDNGEEKHFDSVISFSSSVGILGGALAAVLGILLFRIAPNLPHISFSVAHIIAFFISLFLKEPKSDTLKFDLKNYFDQLARGFKNIFHKELLLYFIFYIFLVGIIFMYDTGFIKPAIAISFGFLDVGQSIVFALTSILGGLTVLLLPKIRKRVSDFKGLMLLMISLSFVWLLFYFNIGFWGVLPMLLIVLIGSLSRPWISTVVNKRIESRDRATTISTMSLISQLPYVVIAIIAGRIVEAGNLREFNFSLFVIILIAALINYILYYILNKKKQL